MLFREFRIKVITRAATNQISELPDGRLLVETKYPPENGLANMSIVQQIAEYYSVTPKTVVIVSGHTSPNKTVRIYEK